MDITKHHPNTSILDSCDKYAKVGLLPHQKQTWKNLKFETPKF